MVQVLNIQLLYEKNLNEPLMCEDYIRYIDWEYEEHSESDIDDPAFEEQNIQKNHNEFFKNFFCCCLKY